MAKKKELLYFTDKRNSDKTPSSRSGFEYLVKQDIINEIGKPDWSIDDVSAVFYKSDFVTNCICKHKGIEDTQDKEVKTIFDNIEKDITYITAFLESDKQDYNYKVFFNDKPIIIYDSEIETIREISRKYRTNNKDGRRVVRLICLMLAWQKAYHNKYYSNRLYPYAPLNIEKLSNSNSFVEATDSKRNDSSAMLADFKKLREDGYVSVILPEVYTPRETKNVMPEMFYKVNFCITDSSEETIALEISDFKYIWEQIFVAAFKEFEILEEPKQKDLWQGIVTEYDNHYKTVRVYVPEKDKNFTCDSNRRYKADDNVCVYIQDSKKGKIDIVNPERPKRVYVTYRAVKKCSKCGKMFYAKQMGNGMGNCEKCNRR